jgi:hypothetical protein
MELARVRAACRSDQPHPADRFRLRQNREGAPLSWQRRLVRQLFVDRMAHQGLSNTLRDKQLLTGNEDSNAEPRESSSKGLAASIAFPSPCCVSAIGGGRATG